MVLSFDEYRDKLLGCWVGKNIGGVLGAPFEGKRQVNQIDFYAQDLSNGPPPNDDLDLQVVWLAAVERYGRQVNSAILGEYWLSYVIPNWVEYGTGKANLRAGLMPPMSGMVDNTYRDSCGAFIRSEIWACLAPGHPEIAARYAYEDAVVDHQGEGVYGEVFFAALQSAAFVERDKRKLIAIGLSYIPEDSAVSRCIGKAVACYDGGVEFLEARRQIHKEAPGTFGVQSCPIGAVPREDPPLEIGRPGYDAPENIGFTIAGWLYGEDDFGRSLCLALSCGEDTDCTCATLGATLGIISGAKAIPAKWADPLDDKIVTMCIDKTSGGIWTPATATEFTDRIMGNTPMFLGQKYCDVLNRNGYTVSCREGQDLYCQVPDYLPFINGGGKSSLPTVKELCTRSPYVVQYDFPAFHVEVDYEGSVFYRQDEPRELTLTVINDIAMNEQQWARVAFYLPQGVEPQTPVSFLLPLNNLYKSKAVVKFAFVASAAAAPKLELLADISLEGRHSSGPCKITLMCEGQS